MIVNNVFEHFMGACIYQDTWPMRDIIIADNIMSDVNQAIRLTCDNMNNFQIRDNIILLNDGYDLKDIVGGVAHTDIDHSLAVGNVIRIRGAKLAGGAVMPDKDVYVTSVPTRSSFTYSLTPKGKNETGDNAVGGFLQALDYQGCMCPAPEAIVVCTGGGEGRYSRPTNFVSTATSSSPTAATIPARVPSSGISVCGLKNSQITDNVVVRQRQSRGPGRQFAEGLRLDGDLPRQLPSRRNAARAQGRQLEDHSRRTAGPAAVRWPEHHVDPCQRQDSD